MTFTSKNLEGNMAWTWRLCVWLSSAVLIDDTLRRPSISRLEKAVSGKLAREYMEFSSIFPNISQKKVREVKKILPFLQMVFFTRRECKGFWHLHTSGNRKFRLLQKKTSNSTTSKAGDKADVSQGGAGTWIPNIAQGANGFCHQVKKW